MIYGLIRIRHSTWKYNTRYDINAAFNTHHVVYCRLRLSGELVLLLGWLACLPGQ